MSAAGIVKAREKRSQIRAGVFPNIDNDEVWDVKNRKQTKGYTSIPRCMPLISIIMDKLAGKGKPISSTYLEIWCRTDEQGFAILGKQGDCAFASGFTGERGVSTWKDRVRRLESLGFITTKPGSSGDLHYAQVWNPYRVIWRHSQNGSEGFSEKHYHALLERVGEIGALDLSEPKKGA